MSKKKGPITFRPSDNTRRWLEIAQLAGFEMSTVINTILDEYIENNVRSNLSNKREQIGELLQRPDLSG